MLLAVFDLTPQMLSFAVCLEFVVKRWQVKPSHFSQCVETCARLSNEFTGYTRKCAIWTELQENRWQRFRKPGRKLKSCRAGCGHDEWATATCLQSAQVGRPPTTNPPPPPPPSFKPHKHVSSSTPGDVEQCREWVSPSTTQLVWITFASRS